MNIKFHYLYRDGANFKQHHFEVFLNNHNFSLDAINQSISSKLIDGECFYANEWDLKDLHLFIWDNEIDHNWHEFEYVEETLDEATRGDILDLIKRIS